MVLTFSGFNANVLGAQASRMLVVPSIYFNLELQMNIHLHSHVNHAILTFLDQKNRNNNLLIPNCPQQFRSFWVSNSQYCI